MFGKASIFLVLSSMFLFVDPIAMYKHIPISWVLISLAGRLVQLIDLGKSTTCSQDKKILN